MGTVDFVEPNKHSPVMKTKVRNSFTSVQGIGSLLSIICLTLGLFFADSPILAQRALYPQHEPSSYQSFGPGEDLTYAVRYGFIKGGEGHFAVTDTLIDGKHINHIVCGGQTTGVADVFYKVRDTYESYMDPKTQLPLMSKRNIREGRYRYNDCVTYNRTDTTLHKWIKRRDKEPETKVIPTKDGIVDIVGAFYHARNNAFNDNLQVGDTVIYNTYFSDEEFTLRILFRGIETVETKIGKIECYKFSPVTEVGRAFKSNDDMHIWISRDKNRIPVKVLFDLRVGSFVCEITDAKGLKYPTNW